MSELGEYRKPTVGERLKARFEYTFKPSGPISKEVVRQVGKIQEVIPYSKAWEVMETVKKDMPQQMVQKDAQYKTEGKWHALKLLLMSWNIAPIVLMVTQRSPAAQERARIKKAAKEWKNYLTKHPEGKGLVAKLKQPGGEAKVAEIVDHLMSGTPPTRRGAL